MNDIRDVTATIAKTLIQHHPKADTATVIAALGWTLTVLFKGYKDESQRRLLVEAFELSLEEAVQA